VCHRHRNTFHTTLHTFLTEVKIHKDFNMAGFVFTGLISCLCLATLVPDTQAFLVSSSNSVANFSKADLGKNLRAYIKHEEIRLGVIKGMEKYEDDVPIVEERLAEFKELEESIAENKTHTEFWDSLKVNHPTTLFAVIRNFMSHFQTKFENHTKYGERFRDFMKRDMDGPLPDKQDLHRVGMALSVIENVYNFSMEEMHKGLIHGHKGEPLSCADMYDIAQTMISDGLLQGATSWIEAAMSDIDLKDIQRGHTTFDVVNALSMLAKVAFAKGDHEKCLRYYEKAVELEPDDQDLYKEYVSHRFGRNVNRLDELDVENVEPWRKRFFGLCRKSLTLDDNNLYDIQNPLHPHLHCRYKASGWVPYSVYREEVINVSPFISIIHNFISCKEAKTIREDTKNTLDHFVLPGNDRVTLWQFKGDLFKDHEYPNVKKVSWKAGDVTGMKINQKTKKTEVSYGEPVHIMDYGVSGLALPHAEFKKDYHTSYMNIDNGKRYATLMVPLADVLVGGATVFIQQNVTVRAKKGMAVLFYSWTPAGTREDDMYVATCPLAVGENIVLEKGIWWTIYDKTNFCGKKPKSSHLARERVIAQHKSLARSQRSKFVPNEEFLQRDIAKTKEALEEKWEAERKAKEEEEKKLKKKSKGKRKN